MDDDWFVPDDTRDPLSERVVHLVFVGGRLVDSWQERASETRWAGYVERPVMPAPPPPPPPPPVHVQVLDWLAEVCGGPEAVATLDTAPLTRPAPLPPDVPDRSSEELLTAVGELLDGVAEVWFDEETSAAFRRALHGVWTEDPLVARRSGSPAILAGGICWAVGKANGLFHPLGTRRVGRVQEHFGLPSGLSGKGNEVALALRGFRGRSLERWGRPYGVPDLLVTGRTDLLLAATREQLIRVRDRATAAAA